MGTIIQYCPEGHMGVKEHRQGGRQYDKLPDAHRDDLDINKMNQGPRMNQIKKLHPLKSLRLAREKALGKHQERRLKKRKQRRIVVAVMSYPTYHFKG